MTRTAETFARRSTELLAVGDTMACWQRSLAEPVRRAARTSALCAWVTEPPKPPRLRRGPLLGHCLDQVLDIEPAIEPAPEREIGREIDRDRDCGAPPRVVGKAEPPFRPAPDRPRRARPPRAAPLPVPQRSRVERDVLCQLADEPAPAAVPSSRAKRPAVSPAPSPNPRAEPIPPPVERHVRPAPCPPETALAPATARVAGRFRDAAPRARVEVPVAAPAGRPVTGPVAPAELLHRHLPSADPAGARRTRPAATAEPAPRRGRLRAADDSHRVTGREGPLPDAPSPRGTRRGWPVPERARRTTARLAEESARSDLPVPVPVPTASERLGPAPVVTASHPPLYEPDPVGAPTVPITGATLRRGAARDAAVPDFLDSADLTDRIARVLQDEARRHGIEV
ncbi:MAG TPA: hypothetical protein VH395_09555 [Jatrophihabitantaceae bacterium]